MSTERDDELERLATANQHVADAERHIAEQLARIETMSDAAQAAESSERVLVPLNAMLMEWTTQRDGILKRLEDLDQQEI